jgi:hypothetical protein
MDVQIPFGLNDEELREFLIQRMNEVDEIKREIRLQIHSASNRAKASKAVIDQKWLRNAKGKIRHLTNERNDIRLELSKVNNRIKESNRKRNGNRIESMATAFMRTAKEMLDPEMYLRIYDIAAEELVNIGKRLDEEFEIDAQQPAWQPPQSLQPQSKRAPEVSVSASIV